MKPNPCPILIEHYSWPVHYFRETMTLRKKDHEVLHGILRSSRIEDRLHKELFRPSMIEWGIATRQKRLRREDQSLVYPRHIRDALWKIYFPDTRPHIYHLLSYVHNQDLLKPTGYADNVIDAIMHQPRLHRRQLDRVRRFAIEYIDAIGSRHRKHGPDTRFMGLYYALNDPKRQYTKGEIITD